MDKRIEYSHWDEALRFMVIPMGPSVREGAPRVDPRTGSRRIYGHQSRYRLEGNRVAFSFLKDKQRTAVSQYRADLERIGSEIDLTRLSRNEQLAFWLNLHNVAVIEALAGIYPISEPSDGKFGPNRASLDDAELVTIAGVALSPRDIRERIVYPNWRDPKVIYGFWRGEIGGPSIQRLAYNAQNLDALLALSAEEFVNSLRGVEKFGGKLRVSRIYEEAAPFYFEDFGSLRTHLSKYARDDVKTLISATPETRYNRYEGDLADLARGERDPSYVPVGALDSFVDIGSGLPLNATSAKLDGTKINPAIARLMTERVNKLVKAQKRGIRVGTVIYGDGRYAPDAAPKEVD